MLYLVKSCDWPVAMEPYSQTLEDVFLLVREECEGIVRGTAMPMGILKTIFPCPAGGMSLSSIPESLKIYGKDVIFLVGGGLFMHGPQLIENVRYFRKIIE